MNQEKILLDRLTQIDPADVAEKVTGGSIHDNAETVALFAAGHMLKSKLMRNACISSDDTMFSNTFARYTRIIGEIGFEHVQTLPFAFEKKYGPPGQIDKGNQYLYAHRALGIILQFEDYDWGGDQELSINGGHFYYSIKFPDRKAVGTGVLSSGGWYSEQHDREWVRWPDGSSPTDLYWRGDHDAREAIRYRIGNLIEAGQFYSQWPASSHLPTCFLIHRGDYAEHDVGILQIKVYEDLRNKRYAALPDWVKAIINWKGHNA